MERIWRHGFQLVAAKVEALQRCETPQLIILNRLQRVAMQTEHDDDFVHVPQGIQSEVTQVGVVVNVDVLELEGSQHSASEGLDWRILDPQIPVVSGFSVTALEGKPQLPGALGSHAVDAVVVARAWTQACGVRAASLREARTRPRNDGQRKIPPAHSVYRFDERNS